MSDQTHRINFGDEGYIEVPQKTIDMMLKRAEEMREERRREAATPGIGAADADYVGVETHDGLHAITAGYAHAIARHWANWQRRRAFDRIPSYAALEPAGNHPGRGATEAELRLGCPAWPK